MKESTLHRALNRAENWDARLRTWDNRFALLRLTSSLILLFFLIPLASGKSPSFMVFCAFLFLCYQLLTSFFHRRFQEKSDQWIALQQSYKLSLHRFNRHFSHLQKHKSPWHDHVAVLPEHHPYGADIDLHKELFLFLNTCSTQGGSEKLFQKLCSAGIHPLPPDEIARKIEMTENLSRKTSFLRRWEALRLSEKFLKQSFAQRTEEKSISFSTNKIILFSVFNLLLWLALGAYVLSRPYVSWNAELLLQPLLLYGFVILFGALFSQPLVEEANRIARVTKALVFIQKKSLLAQNELSLENWRALKQMNGNASILSLRGNPVFWIFIHIFFPFDAVFTLWLVVVMKKVQHSLPHWQEKLSEFDALASFARLKAENKEFQFFTPQKELSASEFFSLKEMGHPLLPVSKRICNSVTLTKQTPVVLLTGSNMSGKSTFLRAFATNQLFFNMGAPVCASEFSVTLRHLLCAIRIDDSLAEGTSYFYAEVKRLAQILQEVKKFSASSIFFVDEIFKGTNNKERYLGSLSLLKAFLQSGACGFVSTHDLALTHLQDENSGLRNMHFCEHLHDKILHFDYTLKEGPCPTTNALFIMKQAGLPIMNDSGEIFDVK